MILSRVELTNIRVPDAVGLTCSIQNNSVTAYALCLLEAVAIHLIFMLYVLFQHINIGIDWQLSEPFYAFFRWGLVLRKFRRIVTGETLLLILN